MPKGYKRIPGLLLKVRTFKGEEQPPKIWAVASIWVDDEHIADVSTLRLDHVEGPGDPDYQAWI